MSTFGQLLFVVAALNGGFVDVVHSLQIPSIAKWPSTTKSSVQTTNLISVVQNPYIRQLHNTKTSSTESATTTTTTTTTLFASNVDSSSSPSTDSAAVPTLSSDTTWMIRMTLRNIKTQKGRTITNQMYVLNGQFISQENYEPPQGTFVLLQQQQQQQSNSTTVTDTGSSMKIVNSRWILSEDPNDRKDGLWIWGLFQQPLYPFLLLSLETNQIPISSSSNNNNDNDDDNDYIPALQLYVQLDHNCNRDTGAVTFTRRPTTSSDTNNYELMIRQKEIIAADPLSLSKVEIYEEVSIGTFSIQAKQ